LGIVLSAAHLHHGLRGSEADRDRDFAAQLAATLGLSFHTHQVDTAAEAALHGESVEEAARRLRYAWLRSLMSAGHIDAVATAHSLDDQAETVLGKFLRGAWTEGLSGIHPVVQFAEGLLLRPLLATSRAQIEAYLRELGQGWCEDSSNQDAAYKRNRIRHKLLPELEGWNPRIREHLANMAELARAEEAWAEGEVLRLAPQLLLAGRPVRGGGRAGSDGATIAIDVVRLGAQPVALQRRLLRYAAGQLGAGLRAGLGFEAAESLRQLAVSGRCGQRLDLPGPIAAERTPRELRLSPGAGEKPKKVETIEVSLPVPGEAEGFGWRFRASASVVGEPAIIRNWRAGDRVTLRYSSGPRKVKEVLERLKVSGSDRLQWPVVAWQGEIVWMQGAELVANPRCAVTAEPADSAD
jgi:tRNA(Ile)-lysidine synthase